ncbi:MAG: cyclic nucleotide-binding domain-containing protein [Sterolibacterium sp.]|nr:cyclic nucleotide-binding domain-containing protein [Sterolibacterium sp.]
MASARQERFPQFEFLGSAVDRMNEIDAVVQRVSLFDGFGHADLIGVLRHMHCYRAPAGAEIIHEGEPGEFALLLLGGSIEILRRGADGLPQRISVVAAGDTLGEMSLVDGEPRFASCVAVDTVTFAVLDRNNLKQILTDEPHLGIKMLSSLLCLLNQRLRDTGRRLVEVLAR